MNRVLGIVGAGKLGTTLGLAASDAGWQVLMCDVAPIDVVAMIVEAMVPQAQLVSLPELVARADIVLLAIPFGLSDQLDYSLLDGKVVLDPMNYWPAVDGDVAALHGWTGSTTDLVALRNPRMRIAKTLNHLGYNDYAADARSGDVPDRRAVAVATDDPGAGELVAQLVDDIGFEPVLVPFDRSKLLEPDGPVFGRWLDAPSMRQLLGVTPARPA
ncbi:MAG: NAD(P)-binding domain-containing protein [Acidobacteriota bacterium]|nr:NAD(P)-binding domain-containing protein [Acidobacteriota bacterium]